MVDKAAVFPDSANDNQPELCPMPGLDKPGERGRDYEDYVKSVVNPVDTTPRYWGFSCLTQRPASLFIMMTVNIQPVRWLTPRDLNTQVF